MLTFQDNLCSFTLLQPRICDSIRYLGPGNWENCPIIIQDPGNSKLNLAAEITKEEFSVFQEVCRRYHTLANRESRIFDLEVTIDLDKIKSGQSFERQQWEDHSSNLAIEQQQLYQRSPEIEARQPEAPIPVPSNVLVELVERVDSIMIRTDERIRFESGILEFMSQYIRALARDDFVVHQYGSTTYGFGGDVDLNIWIETGKY